MSLANVNIGAAANDGTGDPLRSAFSTINRNFANLAAITANANVLVLASGNANVTAIYNPGVQSVNGFRGNVVLDVTHISQAASIAYVNTVAAQTANLATNLASKVTTVAWANVSGKPNFAPIATTGSWTNLTNVPNNVTYAVTQSEVNFTVAPLQANITSINGNVTAVRTQINQLFGNAQAQQTALNLLNSKINAANASIAAFNYDSANASVAAANLRIDALVAGNIYLSHLVGINTNRVNAANVEIDKLRANITAANANAALQSTDISSLRANIIAANLVIAGFGSESAAIANLQANSNALINNNYVVSLDNIGTLNFPTGAQLGNISTYGPGLSTGIIDSAGMSVGTDTGNIIIITPNNGINVYSGGNLWVFQQDGNLQYPDSTVQTTAFIPEQYANIDQLSSNVSSLGNRINAANLAISNKAGLSGAAFTGNVYARGFHSNNNIEIDGILRVGPAWAEGQTWATPGASFYGNTADSEEYKYYQVNLQNVDSTGAGAFVITADDGNVPNSNFMAMAMFGTAFSDPNYPYAMPHDGLINVNGGNLALVSRDNDVIVGGNVANIRITQSGNLKLTNTNLVFNDDTRQTTAYPGISIVSRVNANVTAANAKIATLESNVSTLFSNASSQGIAISSLQANSVVYAANITTLFSNAGTQGQTLLSLQSNAQSQQTAIIQLQANCNTYVANIATLVANAAVQSANIADLTGNAIVQSLQIAQLDANVGTLSDTLDAAVISVNGSTQDLADNIDTINANVTAANIEITSLQSNITAANIAISTLTSNAVAQASALDILTGNIVTLSDAANIAYTPTTPLHWGEEGVTTVAEALDYIAATVYAALNP
jgi:peptidoglycan hydrolase CwlO-like protein